MLPCENELLLLPLLELLLESEDPVDELLDAELVLSPSEPLSPRAPDPLTPGTVSAVAAAPLALAVPLALEGS